MNNLERLNKIKREIEETGYTFTLYDSNLRYLLNSKTTAIFIKRYNEQIEEGRNTIELDEDSLKDFSLKELKEKAIETVIEYCEVELEEIKEDNDN